MKKLASLTLFLTPFLLLGCITWESVYFEITFDKKNKTEGTIRVVYENVSSTEDSLYKRQKDFNSLLGDEFLGDKFLLDQMQDGMYVKERHLFESKNQLMAEYKALFRNLTIDGERFKIDENEIMLIIDGAEEISDSNGKIVKTEDSTILTWPKEINKIYWRVYNKDNENRYALIQYYRDWAAKN